MSECPYVGAPLKRGHICRLISEAVGFAHGVDNAICAACDHTAAGVRKQVSFLLRFRIEQRPIEWEPGSRATRTKSLEDVVRLAKRPEYLGLEGAARALVRARRRGLDAVRAERIVREIIGGADTNGP